MRTLLFLAVLLLAGARLSGQANCYEKIRRDGLRFLEQRRYGEAIDQFWAALSTCPDKPAGNDLDQLIQRAQREWVGALEASADREKKSAEAEREARKTAETAEEAARASQKRAEASEQEATAQGRRAESLRLSMLADGLRQKGQRADALLLAFLARRISGGEGPPSLRRSFAEAVRDSLGERVFVAKSPIRSAGFVGAGGEILVQLEDESAFLIDVLSKKETRLASPSDRPHRLAASPSGDRLLTWPDDGTAQLFDGDGRPLAKLLGHTEAVTMAAFSPDGKTLATCSRDNTARLWAAADGKLLAVLAGHSGNVYEAVFSPDGDWLATRSSDGTAASWDFSGKKLKKLGAGGAYVSCLAVGPSGLVAVGTEGAGAQLIEAPPDDITIRLKSTSAERPVSSVALWGGLMLVGCSGGRPEIFDREGSRRATIDQPGSHARLVAGQGLASFSDDNPSMAVWDSKGALISRFSILGKKPARMEWSPLGGRLLIGMADGSAYLTDGTGDVLTEWAAGAAVAHFSPDGSKVLAADAAGTGLLLSPEPEGVFEKMTGSFDAGSAEVARAREAFGVSFLPR